MVKVKNLRAAVLAYLIARDEIADLNDRGIDDSGKRDTPSFGQWIAAECRYTEALDNLKAAVGWVGETRHQPSK